MVITNEKVPLPEGCDIILGQAYFIKIAEALYETTSQMRNREFLQTSGSHFQEDSACLIPEKGVQYAGFASREGSGLY